MQQHRFFSLPQPDEASAAHSDRVAGFIRAAMNEAGGSLSFAEYMHLCLYAPGLGYYAAGSRKFGRFGDFVTAPETSAIFGAIVARQCAEIFRENPAGEILELGAGTGRLAADILDALAQQHDMEECRYNILDVSPELRDRQETTLRMELADSADRVRWIDTLPRDFRGVVIANEVLDALPVERFVRRGPHVYQVRVAAAGTGFELIEQPAPEVLVQAVESIEDTLGQVLPDGYRSEVCLAAPQWIADLAASLADGIILLFDYGVGRREYYAPERDGGWLRCHFRHHAHDDPLVLPGIQDLTSWVDFTAIAEAGNASGLEVGGFVAQAQFLIGGGLDKHLAEFADLPTDAQLKLSAEIKLLTLPSEMGEHFKCLALTRGETRLPSAFNFADRTASLG
jgi:SAM-dependent MidA family methyltransferase